MIVCIMQGGGGVVEVQGDRKWRDIIGNGVMLSGMVWDHQKWYGRIRKHVTESEMAWDHGECCGRIGNSMGDRN